MGLDDELHFGGARRRERRWRRAELLYPLLVTGTAASATSEGFISGASPPLNPGARDLAERALARLVALA